MKAVIHDTFALLDETWVAECAARRCSFDDLPSDRREELQDLVVFRHAAKRARIQWTEARGGIVAKKYDVAGYLIHDGNAPCAPRQTTRDEDRQAVTQTSAQVRRGAARPPAWHGGGERGSLPGPTVVARPCDSVTRQPAADRGLRRMA